ncbi:MAG: hypothetical protein ACK5MZ_01715 [Aestuariibaculum sp.]
MKITTIIMTLMVYGGVFANIPVAEKEALQAIYNATYQWKALENEWDLKRPVSTWYGGYVGKRQGNRIKLT